MNKKKCRSLNRNKKKRLDGKMKLEEHFHDQFMNYHLDEMNCSTHSIGILNKKEFNRLKENVIIVTNPSIVDDNKQSRKIYYTIKTIGTNIKLDKREKGYFIKFREIKRRFVMIVVEKKYFSDDGRIMQFEMINTKSNNTESYEKNEYLILMQAGDYNDNTNQIRQGLETNDLRDIKNVIPNQMSKEKHFGSLGDVYSIGYTAKYTIKNELSFDRFVTSE